MEEKCMSERVQVLGVEVDKLGVNRAVNIARTYLKNVNLNIIYFVSKNSAVYAQNHEEFAQFVSQADMVMPADKDMQEVVFTTSFDRRVKSLTSQFLVRFFSGLNHDKKSVYVLGTANQVETYETYIKGTYPEVIYHSGVVTFEEEMDIELLINNINAEAPDVLFLITGEVKQVELLKQIKPMLNAKLCVCMGDVLDDFIFLLKDRNTFMEKLQFFSKCKGLFSKQMIHNKIIDRIFKNRIRKSNQGKEN